MTLAELLPSIGCSTEPVLEEGLWPDGTHVSGSDLVIGGVPATRLAAQFGTPCQVLDEMTVRRRAQAFTAALPDAEVVFAGKSLPCPEVYRWMASLGLSLDVSSAGELALARAAGFPASRIVLHGNVKTGEDLKAALEYGVSRIVVDSFDEIAQLGALARHGQHVMIRVTPGVDAHTHAAIATGVEDQKFGFSLASGAALEAVLRVVEQPSLRLVGLHCHIGSQVRHVASYEEAVRRMVGLIASCGVRIEQLDLGGGFCAPYLPGEPSFDLFGFAQRVRGTLNYECRLHRVPVPRVLVEPGRAIVANAGVTLYRVCAVKRGVSRTFVAVDGGMSDNPRPALYGAQYVVRLVGRGGKLHPVTVVGRHCEAGDVLAENVPLPADVHAGDVLAVPATGAYHHALASNYNQVGRPPVVAVADGTARPIVRRETEEDLLRRYA
ncbi:diaminopimelate decarboxylase [Lentzea flava]|uniref:Diaminopimelate decarboxylase n=1 Tax=Lentzea flava TaxID=103732 RepID=A0ABQ2UU64_9PSEU|nr:diaminopimelate decarboxylase [Lentzea flava]MCP2201986.1 diaminopimelate decarboxylase [Lentzea flava]GGU54119.1 diaminopimelate decarboxylase [Lentzea flava]